MDCATLTAPTQFIAEELPTKSPSFFNKNLKTAAVLDSLAQKIINITAFPMLLIVTNTTSLHKELHFAFLKSIFEILQNLKMMRVNLILLNIVSYLKKKKNYFLKLK